MADKRLSPDQLRARLAANLANSPERGAAVDAAREIARDLSREVVDRLPKTSDPAEEPAGLKALKYATPSTEAEAPVGLTALKHASSPAVQLSVDLTQLRAGEVVLEPAIDPVGPSDGLGGIGQGSDSQELPVFDPEAGAPSPKPAQSPPSAVTTAVPAIPKPQPTSTRSATERASSARPTIAAQKAWEDHPAVVHRHHEGAVLRGYRIAAALHRRAERAKLEVSARRGAVLFWDEMMQLAIDDIPGDLAVIANALPVRSGAAAPAGGTRVLQAAIRADQEVKLRMLRLDLEEVSGTTVRLEDVWTWLVERVIASAPRQ
jgi:hypothetical protein